MPERSGNGRRREAGSRDEAGARGNGRAGANAGRAGGLADWARGRVRSELNLRKERVSARLDEVAGTVREVGRPLARAPYATLGDYAEGAAERLEYLASELRGLDVAELPDELRRLGQRRPLLLAGAGFAVGLLAARFLKSSSPSVSVERG